MSKRARYDGPHEEVAVFDSDAALGAGPKRELSSRGQSFFVGRRELPLLGEVRLVERDDARHVTEGAHHEILNLE